MRDEEYFAIKDRAALAWRRIPHITGVGIGGRERNGRPTGEIVIKVFVLRKKPAVEVPPDEMIPASFEGVPTDVVEMGPASPANCTGGAIDPEHTMQMDDVHDDPLRGGMVVTVEKPTAADPNNNTSGTIGCFLRDLDDDTAIYGLTNHHVVADGALSLSRRVLHRSSVSTGFDILGYPAAGANEKEGDYAIVRIKAGFNWLPSIKEIGLIGAVGTHDITVPEAATQTYEVRKYGGRTKCTRGVVAAIGVVNVVFPTRRNFDTVIRAMPAGPSQQVHFSWKGDSGSVVVNHDNEVVALVWGGEGTPEKPPTSQFPTTSATPIKIVLQRLKEIHGFNLEVARTPFINSTEAEEVKEVASPAGAPALSGNDLFRRGDHAYHRPLVGGSQIVAEPFGLANSATLGCVVTMVDDPGKGFLLTSHSGLAQGGRTPTTDTDVGQPDNSGSCSQCCDTQSASLRRGASSRCLPRRSSSSETIRSGSPRSCRSE